MRMEVCKEKWRNGKWASSSENVAEDSKIPTPPQKVKRDVGEYAAHKVVLPDKNIGSMHLRKKKGRYERVGICANGAEAKGQGTVTKRPPWGWCNGGVACGEFEGSSSPATTETAPELPLIHKTKRNPVLGEASCVSEDYSMVSSYVSPRGCSQWRTAHDSSGRLVNVLSHRKAPRPPTHTPPVKTLDDLLASHGSTPTPFPVNNAGPQLPNPRNLKRTRGYHHHGRYYFEDSTASTAT